jgi:hypothetical protein
MRAKSLSSLANNRKFPAGRLGAQGTEAAGWNDWGHQAMLLGIVPILGWAAARRFTNRG